VGSLLESRIDYLDMDGDEDIQLDLDLLPSREQRQLVKFVDALLNAPAEPESVPVAAEPSPKFPEMEPDGNPLPCAAHGDHTPSPDLGLALAPSNPPPSQDTAPEVPDKAPAPTMAAPPHAEHAIDECQRQGDGTVEENMMQRETVEAPIIAKNLGYVASV
jgi:hypothetical protein